MVFTCNRKSHREFCNAKGIRNKGDCEDPIRGTISAETIDQLVGIFTLQEQAARLPTSELEPLEDSTSESALLEVNKTYFAKTTNLIKRVRDYSAINTGERAQWNGQMARRIDDLPTLNVDPELVDFSVRDCEAIW